MRRWSLRLLCAVAAAIGGAEEAHLAPETLLLARIKVKMAENLTRLPNYTCLQTIERSRRRASSGRFELVDTLRLEVALVGGKELFSWPGAKNFEEKDIGDMVTGGAIGNGNFGLHARSVFLSGTPTFTWVGESIRDGRKTVRFNYRVPRLTSGYRIKIRPEEAIVGYYGSFWVDASTLDLQRLEVHADEIPPHLPISSASNVMEYARVRIGEGGFLLPRSSELVMIDLAGNESRNRTTFSDCRQYSGESVLSFAEPPAGEHSPAETAPLPEIDLPGGLLIELHLDTPIDSDQSAVGDPVRATVRSDVKRNGRILVPKGAVAAGRIVRLQKRRNRLDYFLVGVRFWSLEAPEFRAGLRGAIEEVGPFFQSGGRMSRWSNADSRLGAFRDQELADPEIFSVRGDRIRLPRGLRMVWRTLSSPYKEQQ